MERKMNEGDEKWRRDLEVQCMKFALECNDENVSYDELKKKYARCRELEEQYMRIALGCNDENVPYDELKRRYVLYEEELYMRGNVK